METGTDGSQYASDMDRRAPLELHLSGGETFVGPVTVEPHMPGLNNSDSMPAEMSDSPCTTDRQYLSVTPMTPMEEQGTYCPSPALSYQPPSVATSVISEASSIAEDTIIEDNVPNANSYGLAVRHTNTLSEPEEGSNLVHGRIKHQLGPLPQAKIGKPEVQCDRSRGERVAVQYRLPSYCTCSRHGFGVQYIIIDCSLSISLSFSCLSLCVCRPDNGGVHQEEFLGGRWWLLLHGISHAGRSHSGAAPQQTPQWAWCILQ